jgi:hypothetical protein
MARAAIVDLGRWRSADSMLLETYGRCMLRRAAPRHAEASLTIWTSMSSSGSLNQKAERGCTAGFLELPSQRLRYQCQVCAIDALCCRIRCLERSSRLGRGGSVPRTTGGAKRCTVSSLLHGSPWVPFGSDGVGVEGARVLRQTQKVELRGVL